MNSAYQPFAPAKRPGVKPSIIPIYRILVHRKFQSQWDDLAGRVGMQQAQQFWDHVSQHPGQKSAIASITPLKGKAGEPMGAGWSRTYHYEISGAGRVNYQFHDRYTTSESGDEHKVVFVRTIDFSSH